MSESNGIRVIKKRSSWQIQCAVVFALMMRELKTRFGGHWAGFIWLLGVPLLELVMIVWANTVLRGRVNRGTYEFVVFLVVALMPYKVFRSLWSQLTNSISSNKGLFGFKQVKPMDTFIARTMLEIVLNVVLFLLLALGLVRFGFGPMMPVDLLAYLGVVLLFCLLGIAIGVASAVICDVLPRFSVVTHLIAMPLMILSGVIFPLHNLPPAVLELFLLNPVLHLVELARQTYLAGYVPVQGVNVRYPVEVIIVIMAIAVSLYRVRRRELIAS